LHGVLLALDAELDAFAGFRLGAEFDHVFKGDDFVGDEADDGVHRLRRRQNRAPQLRDRPRDHQDRSRPHRAVLPDDLVLPEFNDEGRLRPPFIFLRFRPEIGDVAVLNDNARGRR
jgi:hypothetical protein